MGSFLILVNLLFCCCCGYLQQKKKNTFNEGISKTKEKKNQKPFNFMYLKKKN
jgi:hypothetical protein